MGKFLKIRSVLVLLAVTVAGLNCKNQCYKLSFGSCFKTFGVENSDILKKVAAKNPDSFVWLGDLAYLDRPDLGNLYEWLFAKDWVQRHKLKFENSVKDPNYLYLKNHTRMYYVWDDHDYGVNDGDSAYQHKAISKKIFLEAIDEPEDSPRWNRNGVYDSYYLDEKQQIKLILLDNRYSLMPYSESLNAGFKDTYGEQQWQWIEQEIKEFSGRFLVFGSGIQFVNDSKYKGEVVYPDSKRRLYSLLAKYNQNGAIVISGDVHHSEINTDKCAWEILGYDFYDFTSSGLTEGVGDKQYQTLFLPVYDFLLVNVYNESEQRYYDNNFGMLEICDDRITMESFDEKGKRTLYRELSYQKDLSDKTTKKDVISLEQKLERFDECVEARGPLYRRIFHLIFTERIYDIDKYKGMFQQFGWLYFIYRIIKGILCLVWWLISWMICGKKLNQGHSNNKMPQKKLI